jgi:hypothetical protein
MYLLTYRNFKFFISNLAAPKKAYNYNKLSNTQIGVSISFFMQTYFLILNMFDPFFYKRIGCVWYAVTIILGVGSFNFKSRSALKRLKAL